MRRPMAGFETNVQVVRFKYEIEIMAVISITLTHFENPNASRRIFFVDNFTVCK